MGIIGETEARLEELVRLSQRDEEAAHVEADELVIKLLEHYGGDDVRRAIDLYESVNKWYA